MLQKLMNDSTTTRRSPYYTPVWKETKSGFAGVSITPGDKTVWLCFIDPRSHLDRGILDAAVVTDSRKIEVTPGKVFKKYSANRYRINPEAEEDYQTLISDVLNDFGTIGGVIHTWSCSRPAVSKSEQVTKSQRTRTISALWLGKALGEIGNLTPIPVNFVTRGLLRGTGCNFYPANQALAGAVGVIQTEYPNLITKTIDLGDRKFDIRTGEALHKVLNGDRHHLKLAMKDGSWWIPGFENDDPDLYQTVEPVRQIKDNGVYIITGEPGDTVSSIAKTIGSKGRNLNFILVSREEFPDRSEWKDSPLGDLEQNGNIVQTVKADLSIPGLMEDTLLAIQKQHERIDGVVHTFGSPTRGALTGKENYKSTEQSLAGKAIPALGIYRYFSSPDNNTDFVIFFSSPAADLASFGRFEEAAANSWLDSLAELAWAEGHPFFSIGYPDWEEPDEDTWSDGFTAITPDTGLQAFFDTLSFADTARTIVANGDFSSHYTELLEERQPALNRADEQRAKIEAPVEQMLSLWKKELKNNGVKENGNWFEMGGDSMHAVGLLRGIQDTFDQSIPMSLLIKAPTAAKLVHAMGIDTGDVEKLPAKELPPHIVPLRTAKKPGETPLFCIHAAEGGVMFYQGFASQLKTDRPVYGIESRFFHDEAYQLETGIDAMARHYLQDIREFQPEGPYIFAGYSFGALVALRMAQIAEEEGDSVEALLLYNMYNPAEIRKYSLFQRAKVIWDKRSILPFSPRLNSCFDRFGEIIRERTKETLDYYRYKSGKLEGELARHTHARHCNETLIKDFVPEEYRGRTLLVETEDSGDKYDYGEILGWRKVLKDKMSHRFVTGLHGEIFTGTHLELLVKHTDYFLKGAPRERYEARTTIETTTPEEKRFAMAGLE